MGDIELISGRFQLHAPQHPEENEDVCEWLERQGVQGVLCSGIPQRFQVRLDQHGIWAEWGQAGQVEDVIRHWLTTHQDRFTERKMKSICLHSRG